MIQKTYIVGAWCLSEAGASNRVYAVLHLLADRKHCSTVMYKVNVIGLLWAGNLNQHISHLLLKSQTAFFVLQPDKQPDRHTVFIFN